MQKQLLLSLLAVLSAFTLSASRPTVHASSLRYTNLNCNSLTLQWTNGDGQARMVVAREGTNTTYTPQDGTVYSANSNFGNSAEYPSSGSGNFIVYNGPGSSATISNLKAGKSYTFSVYEHDNNGSNTLYYSTSAPGITVTSYDIKLELSIQAIDSCEKSNRFLITNTSQSTIPGIRYTFNLGKSYDTLPQITHSFTGSGYKFISLTPISTKTGCPTGLTQKAKIFPRRQVNLDLTKLGDTIQCFSGNYFEVATIPISQPFPLGITYAWHIGDSQITHFPKLRKTFTSEGRYKIMLITNITSYSKPTACFDTLYMPFPVRVRHNPGLNMQVDSTVRYLKGNRFFFSNIDTSLMQQTWYFGDGDSAQTDTCSHHYRDTGPYAVKLRIRSKDGCLQEQTLTVQVLADPVSDISQAETASKRMRVYPVPAYDYVVVELKHLIPGTELQIIDLQCRVLMRIPEPASSNRIALDLLTTGQYMLLLMQNGQIKERVFFSSGQP